MRHRKALLFTALTLLLMGSILMATLAFVKRADSTSDRFASKITTQKMVKIGSDISLDYFEIMQIDVLDIYSAPEASGLNMSLVLSPDLPDPLVLMVRYRSYLEGNYSLRTNTNISPDISMEFSISPSDATCTRNSTYFTIRDLPADPALGRLVVIADLSCLDDNLSAAYSSSDPGSTPAEIMIRDADRNVILQQSATVDLSGENLFYAEFNSTDPYPRFTISISDDTLEIFSSNDINATVNIFLLFNSTNTIYLNTGLNTLIRPGLSGIYKAGYLQLMSG